MMIAGAATLMPSDRLACEGEGKPHSVIKQHNSFFQTHLYTRVHTYPIYAQSHRQGNK